VFAPKVNFDNVAAEWIAKYEKDHGDGLKELINFILKVRYSRTIES
jgi:hypothetical protein